ncbi:MAG: type II toxin-antitoxin system RelE/ParE family toxin, partial [Nanoarchaeota archaeon]
MVKIDYDPKFIKTFSKTKHKGFQEQIIKAVEKIKQDPETGKPMRFNRKGTREVYVSPYRLSYAYLKEENKIIIL